jgi:hypothetical protein
MFKTVGAVLALVCSGAAVLAPSAMAASLDKALAKLSPDERAHQACVIKGMSKIHSDKKLPGADSIEPGAFGAAVIKGTTVTAKGGAIRAKHKWYELSFECTTTPDFMKALTFTYKIGAEIPKAKWEQIGLWE